jgi:hypothetical protein
MYRRGRVKRDERAVNLNWCLIFLNSSQGTLSPRLRAKSASCLADSTMPLLALASKWFLMTSDAVFVVAGGGIFSGQADGVDGILEKNKERDFSRT